MGTKVKKVDSGQLTADRKRETCTTEGEHGLTAQSSGEAVAQVEVVEYAFPSKSRCPRCKGTNTKATHTRAEHQYRECQAPVCRYRYRVSGEKV